MRATGTPASPALLPLAVPVGGGVLACRGLPQEALEQHGPRVDQAHVALPPAILAPPRRTLVVVHGLLGIASAPSPASLGCQPSTSSGRCARPAS